MTSVALPIIPPDLGEDFPLATFFLPVPFCRRLLSPQVWPPPL
jgi:hypothetical protein